MDGLREAACPHVGGILGHGAVNIIAQRRVFFDEARFAPGDEAEHVFGDQNLAIASCACADTEGWAGDVAGDIDGQLFGHAFDDDGESAGVGNFTGVVHDFCRARLFPALRAETALRIHGLGEQADMAHDGHTARGKIGNRFGHLCAAFDFYARRAGFAQDARGVTEGDFLAFLIGAKGHIDNDERIYRGIHHGAAMADHHLHIGLKRRGFAVENHRDAIAHEEDIAMRVQRARHGRGVGGQGNDGRGRGGLAPCLTAFNIFDGFAHEREDTNFAQERKEERGVVTISPESGFKKTFMGKRFLQIFAVLCMMVGATAFAQDRAVPETQAQMTMSFAPLVKKTAPAVVNIYTRKVVQQNVSPFMGDPMFQRFFGDMGARGLTREQVESSLGSGVIVDKDGLIVTNAHVVKDAQEIMVVLSDRREFEAKLSLVDERSDIAILRVDSKGEELPFAPLKSSEQMEVGDIVIAIGNPFGVGQTVTSGIVSALARSSLNINDFNFFIQTDAAINPGNSGGPLVSIDGGVVGINTAIFSRGGGSLGIGFAVPSEMVATVIAAEKSGNHTSTAITRAWLGINGQQVTADIADSLGLNRPSGVLITEVHAASPLLKEGMKVGDVVTSINGRPVSDAAELKFRLATVPLGEAVKLDVLRKGAPQSFTVKATAPPDSPSRDETAIKGANPLSGASVANINPAVSVELNLDSAAKGVVVTKIGGGGGLSRLLQPGDIIVAVNGTETTSVKILQAALDKAKRPPFALVIERAGKKTQIVVR